VIGDRALAENNIEYKGRKDDDASLVPREEVVDFLLDQLA
jgi:prolyl-tRNA synthetase